MARSGEVGQASADFEIHILGALPDGTADLFGDLDVTRRQNITIMRGTLDQAALHGLVERIHVLGLELLAIRRIRSAGPPPDP